jgi:hypothetical protein
VNTTVLVFLLEKEPNSDADPGPDQR